MSRAKLMVTMMSVVAAALLFMACTTSNEAAPKLSTAGAHPANWLQVHYIDFVKNQDQCRTCHGSTTDPEKAGGISQVSCFTCHPQGPSHQPGWEAGSQHGRLGAMKTASATAGFAYCAKCHGTNYDNGIASSCKTCHTRAPHPDRPWVGTTVAQPNHVFASITNAPECIKCHLNGANSLMKPPIPAPAGTAPGCFNNTMCHGTSI